MTRPTTNPFTEHVAFLWSVADFEANEDHYRKPENVDALVTLLKRTLAKLRHVEKGNEENITELSRLRKATPSLT